MIGNDVYYCFMDIKPTGRALVVLYVVELFRALRTI